ncbi:hypothetical protein HBH92_166730 [Parastagonospora nodorum]|nr:hypothetical protein HBH92_166730 [Parastagonospora nodorum]KAH5457900.1 hypothetical protein HBI30_060560 [Parastagonospora nodorum]KAH6236766.1 hypothetical protein HBI43_000950 [Parastagonospora nodorum]KAH6278273.1 hypothetical protein HBI41_040760 [Parastagonospora nodorum]KAH6303561.1 hypothetical protein HBI40_015080 [Parastagonospora nodorum]
MQPASANGDAPENWEGWGEVGSASTQRLLARRHGSPSAERRANHGLAYEMHGTLQLHGSTKMRRPTVPIPFSVFPSAYRNAEVKESTSVKVEGEAKVSQQAVHGGEGHEETHESFTATVRQPQPHPHPHPQPQPHPHPQEPAHRDTYVKEEIHITEQERLRRPQPPQHHEEVHIHEQTRYRQPEQPQQVQPPQHQQQHRHEHRQEHVEFQSARDRYQPPSSSTTHTHVEVQDRAYDRHFNTVHGPATDYAPSQIDVTERQFPPTPTTNKPHATRARLSLPRTPIPTKDRLTVSTAATQPRFE